MSAPAEAKTPMGGAAAAAADLSSDSDSSDSEAELQEASFKVIVLGDGAVGKTSIIQRFGNEHFGRGYKQTVGVDFSNKRLVLPGDRHVVLKLWDIGGQTIGNKMIANYCHGAQAVLLCYDITNYQSFQNLEDWLGEVKKVFSSKESMPYIALVGNKIDLEHRRTVKLAKHNQFADDNALYSFLLSAKTGDMVNSTFHRIAADLVGVVLSKEQLEADQPVLAAKIVNHQQHDPAQKKLTLTDKKKNNCVIS